MEDQEKEKEKQDNEQKEQKEKEQRGLARLLWDIFTHDDADQEPKRRH